MSKNSKSTPRLPLDIALGTCDDMKAKDVKHFSAMKASGGLFDWIVICTATSRRHASAITDEVRREAKATGISVNTEGDSDSEWVLIDIGDVVVNVMTAEVREYYDLEGLWDIEDSSESTS